MATLTGTGNPDTLTGGSGNDVITGLGGDDSLNGGDGNDSIDGGVGFDTVHGGNGADTIIAGRGDTIFGEGDNDLVKFSDSGPGVNTVIDGGLGTDKLVLDFSTAVDSITSYIGAATNGGAGGVTYYGFESISMNGGSASDTLAAGAGADTLIGGAGNDRIDAGAGTNVIDGGAGIDIGLIDLTGTSTAVTVNFTGADSTIGGNTLSNIEGLGLKAGSGADTINVSGELRSSEIYGGDGADTLNGANAYADTLDGGAQGDKITFGRGDAVVGGDGDDLLFFSSSAASGASATVDGQTGTDVLTVDLSGAVNSVTSYTGSVGNGGIASITYYNIEAVALIGGSASDTLISGSGNDTLVGNKGNDRLDAGSGVDVVNGGAGNDIGLIDLSATSTGLTVAFKGTDITIGGDQLIACEGLGLKAGSGDDSIDVSKEKLGSEIHGGDGADTLSGGSFGDILDGGNGDDVIKLGRGDTVSAGDGNDHLSITSTDASGVSTSVDGQTGADILTFDLSGATDSVTGYAGGASNGGLSSLTYYNIESVNFSGGSANDTIFGNTGNDTLTGNSGDDYLSAGAGVDSINGGAGSDIGLIDLSATSAAVNVTFKTATNHIGADTITACEGLGLQAGSGGDTISVAQETLGSAIYGNGGADTLTGGAAYADVLDGGDLNDRITFSWGDTVRGGAGDDDLRMTAAGFGAGVSVDGQGDNDKLTLDFSAVTDSVTGYAGGAGNGGLGGVTFYNMETLVLTGGTASDTIFGGVGNDTLAGGSGNDRLDAGAGANSIDGGTGSDIGLVDLSTTTAAINVNFNGASASFGGDTLTHVEGLGIKAGSGADTINLTNETRGSEIYGGDGNDNLTGGAGYADLLDGQTGNDVIVFGAGDTVRGGDGNDDLRITSSSVSNSVSVDGQNDADKLTINLSGATAAITSYAGSGSGGIAGITYYNIETLVITGGSAGDQLSGNLGADTLTGGLGGDTLTGGGGADVFVYHSLAESTATGAGRDVITDFTSGDQIDLSAIDANSHTAGDQAFEFLAGATTFNGDRGALIAVSSGGVTVVSGDVDGDKVADFSINLTGTLTLHAGDFVL